MQCNTLIMSDNHLQKYQRRWSECSLSLIRISTLRKYFPSWCIYKITSAVSKLNKMASTAVAAGIGLAAVGFAGRYLLKRMPNLSQKMAETVKKLDSQSLANNKYYKGGFEPKMTRREASLILGVSPTASKGKVKEQFKKVMSVNHPDRGGSPYIAAKINEAKDLLDK